MTVHVLTSYKGGVGKTTIALSIALSCIDIDKKSGKMKLNKNFVLIDTNPQNSNLAEDIFFYFHVRRDKKMSYLEELSKGNQVMTISSDSEYTFTVCNATGSDPFALAKKIQMKDKSNTVFIIDTNVHIRSVPNGLFTNTGDHRVYTWFLWGWSSPRLTHQLEAILDATKTIEEGWPKSQVIHVFNLYDFFTGGLSGLSFRKASRTLKPLKKVLNTIDNKMKKFVKSRCKPVYIDYKTLTSFAVKLHTTLIGYVAPDNLSMEDLPNLWAEHLQNLVKTSNNGFPYNILLIPTFFRELTMSTDRLIMSSPRSFEKIHEQITPMAEFISVFLSALNECEDVEITSKLKPGH